MCCHLTNYAINKDNPNFVFNKSEKVTNVGHKRSWSSILEHLKGQNVDTEKLLQEIYKIIMKTFLSV
jgi:tubulin polyglutamylase TTLL6/13